MVGILNIVFIFSILNFVFYLLFTFTVKSTESFRILRISTVVTIISMLIISYILYLNGTRYEDIGNKKNYVIGQITYINNKEIKLRVVDSNLRIISKNKIKNEITIKLADDTSIRKQHGIFERSVNYSNLALGDVITVICDDNKLTNNYIIAQKVTIK